MVSENVCRTLQLDELDDFALNRAIAVYQRLYGREILPEYESSLAGVIIGEICRDWLESRGEWIHDGIKRDE
jgi:hypothetical protein